MRYLATCLALGGGSFPGVLPRYRSARRQIHATVAALFNGAEFGLIRPALSR